MGNDIINLYNDIDHDQSIGDFLSSEIIPATKDKRADLQVELLNAESLNRKVEAWLQYMLGDEDSILYWSMNMEQYQRTKIFLAGKKYDQQFYVYNKFPVEDRQRWPKVMGDIFGDSDAMIRLFNKCGGIPSRHSNPIDANGFPKILPRQNLSSLPPVMEEYLNQKIGYKSAVQNISRDISFNFHREFDGKPRTFSFITTKNNASEEMGNLLRQKSDMDMNGRLVFTVSENEAEKIRSNKAFMQITIGNSTYTLDSFKKLTVDLVIGMANSTGRLDFNVFVEDIEIPDGGVVLI